MKLGEPLLFSSSSFPFFFFFFFLIFFFLFFKDHFEGLRRSQSFQFRGKVFNLGQNIVKFRDCPWLAAGLWAQLLDRQSVLHSSARDGDLLRTRDRSVVFANGRRPHAIFTDSSVILWSAPETLQLNHLDSLFPVPFDFQLQMKGSLAFFLFPHCAVNWVVIFGNFFRVILLLLLQSVWSL